MPKLFIKDGARFEPGPAVIVVNGIRHEFPLRQEINFDKPLKNGDDEITIEEVLENLTNGGVDALILGNEEEAGAAGVAAPASEDEPGPLDKSIPDLTAHLENIDDPAVVDGLIADEKAGKSRTGALAALEARKSAIAENAST